MQTKATTSQFFRYPLQYLNQLQMDSNKHTEMSSWIFLRPTPQTEVRLPEMQIRVTATKTSVGLIGPLGKHIKCDASFNQNSHV